MTESNFAPIAPDFDTSGPWVSIVFADGDDYEAMIDHANDEGGSVDAAVAYLAQWDFGDETDGHATRARASWGSGDTLYTADFSGITYVYAVNHIMGHASLNRRPLDA